MYLVGKEGEEGMRGKRRGKEGQMWVKRLDRAQGSRAVMAKAEQRRGWEKRGKRTAEYAAPMAVQGTVGAPQR